ncbi:MAG: thioether cross-link-forming SCIFF peptide maturase [Selenomonadaceae bacterium]|nr:thioether cross-link-forming SCIFF peptide maturase [Selenomonadaceae bacterium]
MKAKIHKFEQGGHYILLDINSGAVHVIDKMIYDMMDTFDGTNDAAVIEQLADTYPRTDLEEACGELHELMDEGELFAPDIDVPPTFKVRGLVKSICLMIAQDCNLRCKYCFGDGGSYGQTRAVMSPEVGRKAVDYLIQASGPRKHLEMDFFGGEPLMNKKTVKAVTEYARQREKETGKKFKLTMTTNGMLLDDETIAWLNDNDFALVLSLDGRKEVHDAMRPTAGGKGSYDRAVKNFKKVLASRHGGDYDYRGVYTFLRGTYTKKNLDFTKDVLSMNDEGFDILSMEPVVLKDSPIALTEEDLPRIREEYDRLTEAYMQRHREGKGFFFFHFNMDLSNGPCVAKRLSGCGAGHEYVAVAENGDLYPCHQFVGREGYKIGTVDEGITNHELSQYFRESHVLNKPKCRDCWARFFCSGGCHANADLFHGNIREPYEVGCEIQKKRLECAILVQALLAMEKMEKQ